MNSFQDAEVLDLIEKCQEIIDQYEQDDEISTVLLIGEHYSGKSTIFNFLSGANFNFNDETKQIEIANKSDKFSQMNNGKKSITKTPLNVYKNNQNNHVIIDFPAEFLNTDETKDQQLIQLLFNKIVTSRPIKLIYIINCPEGQFPNRGVDLQNFSKKLKNPYYNLILNKNDCEESDEQLICQIKEELVMLKEIYRCNIPSDKQILILRRARKNTLDVIFNENSRNALWYKIEQARVTEIEPLKILQSDKGNSYINNLQWEFVNEYLNNLLYENQEQNDQKYTKKDAEAIQQNMQELIYFVKKGNQKTALLWYQKFIKLCNKIIQNTSINSKKIEESKSFLKIFQFYIQGFNNIDCQSNLDVIISFVQNQLQNIKEIYQKRNQSLKLQDLEKEMNFQFNEIQKTITKLYEVQFQLERENFRLKKENEKEKLQRQLLQKQLKL